MRLSGQLQAFKPVYFFYEKFCTHNCLCCLVLTFFVLLLSFDLWRVSVRAKSFLKKRINKLAWSCPDNLKYYTTDVYPYWPADQEFICMHLFLFVWILDYLWKSLLFVRISLNLFFFMIICANLCLYENKQAYESHHLKQIFYHQKQIIIFCWFYMFQFCVFCFEFFSFCVWVLFY